MAEQYLLFLNSALKKDIEIAINKDDAIKQIFLFDRKFILVLSLINFIGNFIINCLYIGKTFGLYFFNHIDTINLVSVNAVNKDVIIPIAKVTAKPFTGPEPI